MVISYPSIAVRFDTQNLVFLGGRKFPPVKPNLISRPEPPTSVGPYLVVAKEKATPGGQLLYSRIAAS